MPALVLLWNFASIMIYPLTKKTFPLIVEELYTTETEKISDVVPKHRTGLAIIGAICCIFFITTVSPSSCKYAYCFAVITSLGSLIYLCLALIASAELIKIKREFKDAMDGKSRTLYPTGVSGLYQILMNKKSKRMELKFKQSLMEAWGIAGFVCLFAIVQTVEHRRK